jgi:hypothetical protein
MKVLAPKKFGEGNFEEELTMMEFTTLFKTDAPNDKVVQKIKDELKELE